MTITHAAVPTLTAEPAMPNRTLTVVRMQLINRMTFIWMPAAILWSSFAVSMAVYGIVIGAAGDGAAPIYGGGSQAPLWYFAAVGVQAMTLTFPFSQAMSVSRREFYAGTLLTAGMSALGLSVVYLIGGLIEKATDGWGFEGYFFYLPWIWEQGPVVAMMLFLVTSMLAFILGFWAATIYKRFGFPAVIIALIGLLVLAILVSGAITMADGWPSVGRWLSDVRPLTVTGIAAAAAVLFGGVSYLTLRRATPS
ncbi:MAG: hypothetical protein WAV90_04435 [Gordonia amarae]